jgi:uncharacterized protein (UPF0332 family)
VNRAYYAIFYAANAMLATKGLERSKHSGVIATFRQHFVKTGMVEPDSSTRTSMTKPAGTPLYNMGRHCGVRCSVTAFRFMK